MQHFSSSTALFLCKLKYFLESNSLSLQQFISKTKDIKQNQLSRHDFITLIQRGNFNVKPNQIFKELKSECNVISLSDLKKTMSKLGSIQHQGIQMRKKQKIRQKENNKKLTRKAIQRLRKFLSKHSDPVAFLHKFDLDKNDSIDKLEFTKLLIATQIEAFTFKQIRKMVVQSIFNQFNKQEINCNELCHYFRIEGNHFFQKQSHDYKGPFISTLNQIQENQVTVQQKQDVLDNSTNLKIYPSSMRYYHHRGEPQVFEYKALEHLQELLNNNICFIDEQKPELLQAKYLSAAKIFKDTIYHIFQSSKASLMQAENSKIVAQKILPSQIKQGKIKDCYFISSIASLFYNYQHIVIELFLFAKNPANYYAVKLFIDGQWKVISTDDHFPCKGNTTIYASPHKNQIWVMLLQKAWAKEFGSYNAIQTDSSREAFTALTGAPCQVLFQQDYKDQKEFIKQLQSIHKKKYLVTANSLQKIKQKQELGLTDSHSYSFLDIININGHHLAYLRDPQGQTTWKGEWSIGSEKWTKYLKELHKNPKDGSFYMNLVDFRKYFKQIIVCKLEPNFVNDSIRVQTNNHKSAYFSMRVEKSGIYTISVYQIHKKKVKKQSYKYCQARIIILKKIGKQMQYIVSRVTFDKHACQVQLDLTEGEYIISAKVFWTFKQQNELVVTSYGREHVELMSINRSIAPQFKKNMIQSFSKKFPEAKQKSYKYKGGEVTQYINFNEPRKGIGYIKVVNQKNKECEYILQKVEIQNIKLIKPNKFPLNFSIKPGKQKVIGFFINSTSQFIYDLKTTLLRK